MKILPKQYIGGTTFMIAILLILIGSTQYAQLFKSTKNDFLASKQYIQTAIIRNNTQSINKNNVGNNVKKFNVYGQGDILEKTKMDDGNYLIKHYRAIYIPQLVDNYEAIPQLDVEIISNNQKKEWIPAEIHKINRSQGLVYFLLKYEKNKVMAYPHIFTGNYRVNLIK